MSETLNILIADDSPVNVLVLQSFLEKMEYNVIVAVDGQEAVDKYTEDIDAVFMDLCMPIMDGEEATKIIKKKYPNAYIIVSSCNDCQNIIELFDDCCPKPISIERLRKVLSKIHKKAVCH